MKKSGRRELRRLREQREMAERYVKGNLPLPLQDKLTDKARSIAAANPVVRYEPARPVERSYLDRSGKLVHVFELGSKPEHRVYEVPIYESVELATMARAVQHYPRTVKFSPQEWGFTRGATRVRWWTWEPLDTTIKPEQRMPLLEAAAYARRMKEVLEYMGIRAAPKAAVGLYPDDPRLLVEFANTVIASLEQALGVP